MPDTDYVRPEFDYVKEQDSDEVHDVKDVEDDDDEHVLHEKYIDLDTGYHLSMLLHSVLRKQLFS